MKAAETTKVYLKRVVCNLKNYGWLLEFYFSFESYKMKGSNLQDVFFHIFQDMGKASILTSYKFDLWLSGGFIERLDQRIQNVFNHAAFSAFDLSGGFHSRD